MKNTVVVKIVTKLTKLKFPCLLEDTDTGAIYLATGPRGGVCLHARPETGFCMGQVFHENDDDFANMLWEECTSYRLITEQIILTFPENHAEEK